MTVKVPFKKNTLAVSLKRLGGELIGGKPPVVK
jgi:hypothetical protein